MRTTIYKCDQCKKDLGMNVHISLQLNGHYSGIALPPHGIMNTCWQVQQTPKNFVHFCDEKHMAAWFKKLIVEANKRLNKYASSEGKS